MRAVGVAGAASKAAAKVSQRAWGAGLRQLAIGLDHGCTIDGADVVRCWGSLAWGEQGGDGAGPPGAVVPLPP